MSELADRAALLQLVNEYALAIDRSDIDRVVELFLHDGTLRGFTSPGQTEPAYEFVGHEAIYALARRWEPFLQTWHFIGTHASEVVGDDATARSYCLAHHLLHEDEVLLDRVMSIVYDDVFSRAESGWRLRSRTVLKLWAEDRPATR